jgi:hypothetical protein
MTRETSRGLTHEVPDKMTSGPSSTVDKDENTPTSPNPTTS